MALAAVDFPASLLKGDRALVLIYLPFVFNLLPDIQQTLHFYAGTMKAGS